MKSMFTLALCFFSFSALADYTSIVTWKPKEGATHEQVKQAVKTLNGKVKGSEGLITKHTLYNAQNKTWVDVVVWKDSASAEKVAKAQGEDPEIQKLGDIIDFGSINSVDYQIID